MENTDYNKQAIEFLNKTNTKMTRTFIGSGRHFPGEKDIRDRWRVTLSNSNGRMQIIFGNSLNESDGGVTQPSEYDILTCLTKYDPVSFEDFCGDFGYEMYNDYGRINQETKRVYNSVVKEWEGIEKLFSDEQIEQLQEIQ